MSATQTTAEITETRRHRRLLERARKREEPTRTRSVRRRYAQRLRGAWQGIRAALRRGLIENGALGREGLAETPGRGQFDADTDAQTIAAFGEWLETQTERDILNRFGGENRFVTRAYERGVEDAQTELNALEMSQGRAGATALRLPAHRERLESLYARHRTELEGMTDTVATDCRRELSEGLAADESPRAIAEGRLADVIGRVEDGSPTGAMNSATLLAGAVLMTATNAARATEWERAGVQKVGLLIASDACPQCQALKAGEPYLVSDARSLVPGRTHPNCRCSVHVWTDSS